MNFNFFQFYIYNFFKTSSMKKLTNTPIYQKPLVPYQNHESCQCPYECVSERRIICYLQVKVCGFLSIFLPPQHNFGIICLEKTVTYSVLVPIQNVPSQNVPLTKGPTALNIPLRNVPQLEFHSTKRSTCKDIPGPYCSCSKPEGVLSRIFLRSLGRLKYILMSQNKIIT